MKKYILTSIFLAAAGIAQLVAQTATQTAINSASVGTDVPIDGYTWRVAMKVNRPDGSKYAMLYGMSSFHYGIFGSTNDYFASTVRNVFTNRYATDKEYNNLRQIAVIPTLNTSADFSSTAKSELPANPQLASASGATEDVIFLPTVRDVKDWTFNVAGTFANTQRLITRNPVTSPTGNICAFITNGTTLTDNTGIAANTLNSSGILQFRPCIWVKVSPICQVEVDITGLDSICIGATTQLSPTTDGTWISTNSAVASVTDSGLVTGISAGSARFVFTSAGCSDTTDAVFVKALSTATHITGLNDTTVCSGTSIVLTAIAPTVTGTPIFRWYASDTSTTVLYTGNPYTTTSLTDTTTFYVSVEGDNYCEGAADATGRRAVTVRVKPRSVTAHITAPAVAICTGDTATLTATSSVVTGTQTFRWYSSSTSTTVLHTGNTYALGVLTATTSTSTTYYVSVEGDNYCEGVNSSSGRRSVTVTVKPYSEGSTLITANGALICSGSTTTLTANAPSVTSPTFRWYADSTSTTVLRTGNTYTTAALTTTTTFYVSVSGSNYCEGAADTIGRKAVTVTIIPRSESSMITAADTTICGGERVTLEASTVSVTGTPIFRWYENAATTTILHTGNTYATAALTKTTTFYVSVEGDNYCEGIANTTGRKAVTVTVNPLLKPSIGITIK